MIGSLRGIVNDIFRSQILIDVHGVGYSMHISTSFLQQINKGQEIKVFTYTHVREDALELFGFKTIEDLRLFEMLISVNGIGPKTALGVFSIGEREQIMKAVQTADVKFFSSVPRLGTKNAQKIIIELKNKLGSIVDLDLVGSANEGDADIVEALRGFGFKDREIYSVLKQTEQEKDNGKRLKKALKYLGK